MSSEEKITPQDLIKKITPQDLIKAMAAADVLETFLKLPSSSQDFFREWIGKAADDASHWRRIDTLILAIRSAPLLAPEKLLAPGAESEAVKT